MAIDERLLAEALRAAERIDQALRGVEEARAAHQQAIRALYLDGASMREIADRLGISHQRVHQLLDVPQPKGRWRAARSRGDGRGQLACQFCGRSQPQARKLVPGPGTAICDTCAEHGQAALHATDGRATHRPTPDSEVVLTVQDTPGSCSFCGKHAQGRPGLALLVTPTRPGRICTECLALAREIFAESD